MPTVETEQADPNAEDPKSLETRFGLVMYGGVSLAIYINGVAREFFRAVRGAGVYKLIKALTDRDVVVDVISGTSAGGINGIMLSYALCNGKDFASCASLWRLDGDVRSLLRSPHGGADAAESLFDSESYYQPRLEAAFREMPEYVEEQGEINSRFKELDLFITGTDVDGNISTQFDDAGHPIDVKDHRSLFLLKHREGRKHPFEPGSSVDGPSTPETTFQALAKLARITSCFPAAFTPVHVSGAEPPGNATVDGKLQLWGGLSKDSCFLDGGVIDNKPFTYTIREIFSRSADRVVERKLFYVEPDPEHFKRPDVASRPNFVQAVIASLIGIPGYESIADDLRLLAQHNTKVQQYRRLRRHLEERAAGWGEKDEPSQQDRELYDRVSLVALSERMIEGILKVNGEAELLSRKDRTAAAALIEAFDKVQDELRGQRCKDETMRAEVPVFVRNFNVYFRLRRLYRTVYKLVEVLGQIKRIRENENEINRLTNLWRLLNREIEMLDIVRVNMERLIDEAPVSWKDKLAESAGTSNSLNQATIDEARVVWDVVTEGLHRLIDRRGGAAALLREAFKGVKAKLKEFKEDPGLRLEGFDSETLTAFNKALKSKANEIISDINEDKIRHWVLENSAALEGRSRSFRSILQLARMFEEEVIEALLPEGGEDAASRRSAAVKSAYTDFSSFDAQLFPIEFVAGLYEKDVIETIRISPVDAERGFSNKGLSDKVSGDALYHFAGFFKRSWRSNDILWGRLDSLCQLTETLLTPERIEEVVGSELLLERARKRFFQQCQCKDETKKEWHAAPDLDWVPAMHPVRLFPHAGKATQEDLAAWLKRLLLEDHKLDREDFAKTKIARVIEAAQLEVIYEDLPGVITDALEEQARWNQFRYPSDLLKSGARAPEKANGKKGKGEVEPTVFPPVYLPANVYVPAQGRLDAFASVIAAAGAASDAMQHLEKRPATGTTPMDTGVGQFFSRDYRIGSEALLRDLPPLVLLEIVSTTLLVVRNCLLKVFGSQAERIKSHPVYFGLDMALRGFNTLVRFMRRVPSSRQQLPVLLGLLSLILLFVGVMWFNPIVWTKDSGLHKGWFFFFIFGPAVALAAWGLYLYQGKVNERGWLRWAGDAVLILLLVTPIAIVTLVYERMFGTTVAALQEVYVGWFHALLSRWPTLFSYAQGTEGSATMARLSVLAGFGLTYIFPVLALVLVGRAQFWFRSPRQRLQGLLEKYFSIPEMLTLARRLDLFKDEDVQGLAEELKVFDAAALAEIARRHGEILGDFRADLERKLGLPATTNSSVYTETVTTEGRKVRYGVIIDIYNEMERTRKREAYDRLAAELAEIEAEHRAAVEAGLPRAVVLAEEKKVEAINAMLAEVRRVEALKTNLAYASIESAQRTNASRQAAQLLARRIVEEATRRDSGPGLSDRFNTVFRRDKSKAKTGTTPPDDAREKTDEKRIRMLARLEDMMYSINPGAMN
jgi:patatin-related protein